MLVTFITTYIFQFGFADTEQYWQPSWLFTLTFLRINSKHIPLAPDCRVLKNPVWCGFTSIQKLSSGLMLLTYRTTDIKPQVDRFVLLVHRVIVLASGRSLNLDCAPGHPSFEMSGSFTVQMLAQFDSFTY